MLKLRIAQCLGALVFAGCTAAPTQTQAPATSQQSQVIGAECDITDGTDTCNPEQTGVCCCTPGPSTHGFCVDICPNPCD